MKTLFVSSTFKDMQYERDAIQQIVLPKLNAVAKQYGQTLSFCDLRWGINTTDLDSDEGSLKVLDVCLDSIDRCGSPMIVLLGDRYGYIPKSDIIRDVASYKKLELEDLQISVTALEIEYGALSEHQKKNTLFYFRKMSGAPEEYLCEDDDHANKLADLKKRIEKLAGREVPTYTTRYEDGKLYGLDKFADRLVADITAVLLPEWEEASRCSDFDRERKTQWDFINDRNAVCRGRDEFAAQIVDKVNNGSRLVAIKGEAGSGKSVIFSKLAVMLRDSGWDVLPFVGGLTTESNDAADIMRNTAVYLQNKLYGDDTDVFAERCKKLNIGELRERASKLIGEYCAAGHRFIIMVDAVDQLFSDAYRNSLAFIPDVTTDGFSFLATFNDDFKALDVGSIPLSPLGAHEKEEVIRGSLERYGRELDKSVIDGMIALKSSDNPLYLGFLIKRLLMMTKHDFDIINSRGGQMSDISQYQRELIASCPKTTDELCALLLKEAGNRINSSLVTKAIGLIACSRFGWRESDLKAMLADEWNTLDFAHFIMYMGDCFILRDDGRYDFSHKSIRQGLLKTVDVKAENKKIVEYLRSVLDDEIARSEIIYHTMQADDKEFFRSYSIMLYDNANAAQKPDILVPYLYRACEFASDSGEWFADVIRTTPVSPDMIPFAELMANVALYFTSTTSNIGVGIKLGEALGEFTDKFVGSGIGGVGTLRQTVRLMLGQSYITTDDSAAVDQLFDAYNKAIEDYNADSNDTNMLMLLLTMRAAFAIEYAMHEIYCNMDDDDIEEYYDRFTHLLDVAQSRFDEARSMATMRNLFYCLNANAMLEFLDGNFDDMMGYLSRGKVLLLDNLDLISDIAGVKALIDINNSYALVYAGKCDTLAIENAMYFDADDQEEFDVCAKKAIDIFELSAALAKYGAEKLNAPVYMVEYCTAMMQMGVVEQLRGDGDRAKWLFNHTLQKIKELEKTDMSSVLRQLECRIKIKLLTFAQQDGQDMDTILYTARDLAREAENLYVTDKSLIGMSAQLDIIVILLTLLINKCGPVYEQSKTIPDEDKKELLYWRDKTRAIISSNIMASAGTADWIEAMLDMIDEMCE